MGFKPTLRSIWAILTFTMSQKPLKLRCFGIQKNEKWAQNVVFNYLPVMPVMLRGGLDTCL